MGERRPRRGDAVRAPVVVMMVVSVVVRVRVLDALAAALRRRIGQLGMYILSSAASYEVDSMIHNAPLKESFEVFLHGLDASRQRHDQGVLHRPRYRAR